MPRVAPGVFPALVFWDDTGNVPGFDDVFKGLAPGSRSFHNNSQRL